MAVPILPPSSVSWPALSSRCATSAVVVDLPLVPVIATKIEFGCDAPPLAAEQLDVADHLDAGGAREPDRPVRRRMGERHAGREHERRDPAPVDLAQVGGRDPGLRRMLDARRIVVPADHVGAAREQRAGAREPRGAEPEHRDLAVRKCGDGDHGFFPSPACGGGTRAKRARRGQVAGACVRGFPLSHSPPQAGERARSAWGEANIFIAPTSASASTARRARARSR